MQDRIGQLEKLVRDLMGNANNGRSEHIPSYAAGPNTAMTPPSDVDDLNGPEEPVPISDTFGLISLEQTSTSYVENNHWSAILDGVRVMILATLFATNIYSTDSRAERTLCG
jgi:hypothetical protein